MSTRNISPEELDKVQILIEKCIWNYMNKNQVIEVLYQELNIERIFTKLVWEKLEEQNPQFFQAYYLRLKLKDQITQYNHLLRKQVALLQQMNHPHGVVVPNGSHIASMNHNNASYYVSGSTGINAMKTENMHHLTPAAVHGGGFNGYGQFIPQEMQHNMVVQGQNMNGVSAAGHNYNLGNPTFVCHANCDRMESHPPVSSYGIMSTFPHPFMDNTRSSQLLQQFSHEVSNPTADFNNTTGNRITLGPYFPPVRYGDLSREYNNDYHNFGRDS